jgi:hypothetical protein
MATGNQVELSIRITCASANVDEVLQAFSKASALASSSACISACAAFRCLGFSYCAESIPKDGIAPSPPSLGQQPSTPTPSVTPSVIPSVTWVNPGLAEWEAEHAIDCEHRGLENWNEYIESQRRLLHEIVIELLEESDEVTRDCYLELLCKHYPAYAIDFLGLYREGRNAYLGTCLKRRSLADV